MNGFKSGRRGHRAGSRSAGAAISSIILGIAASQGLLGSTARAQDAAVNKITPYFAVVEKGDAALRCGSNDLMYQIATLARGTVLRVDGEIADKRGTTWSQVSYPLGSYVLVPADAVTLDASGKSGTLTNIAKVKAPNQSAGLRGSWADALPQGLPAGTHLAILESEPAGGPAQAYKIAPPEGARAFVASGSLRRASQDEINSYMARAAQPATLKMDAPSAAKTGVPTISTPASTAGSTPSAAAPSGTPDMMPASGTDMTQPMVIPQGNQPGAVMPELSKPEPVTTPGASDGGNAAPGGADGAKPTHAMEHKAPPPASPANPYERLEGALERVRKQPMESAEYSELMSQYQAEINKLDDVPTNKPLRQRLEQRLAYLKLLADTQAERRKIADNADAIDKGQKAMAERLAEVAKVRQYTIVGRLTASTIYDGTRMPLMYRVQATSAGSPRTLAYVKPDPSLKLDSRVGQIIGIIGTQKVDPTVQLNIITPVRVDVLEAAASETTPEAKPSAEAPGGN
jgi:hypothetical protein